MEPAPRSRPTVPSARSVHHLVELQGRRWSREQARAAAPAAPSIAFARLGCAGAREVAERAALRLGFGFFGSEIVDQIAQDEGVNRALVAGLDERVRNSIERYVIDGFRRRSFAEIDYFRAVTRVVSTLAHRGHVVLLGHGAAAIADPAHALRILVVAPLEWRIARFAEHAGVSPDDARERLAVEDGGRSDFYRRNFDFDHAAPLNYDLVVNTAALGIDVAVQVVLAAYTGRFGDLTQR
jgi:cytidylate kinase